MSGESNRSILRPYYDPETFNIGYSSVFQPSKGVIDQNGFSLATKLSISKKQPYTGASKMIKHKVLARSSELNWNDVIDSKRWQAFISKHVVNSYLRIMIQQPFETCKILLQVSSLQKSPTLLSTITSQYIDESTEVDFFPSKSEKEDGNSNEKDNNSSIEEVQSDCTSDENKITLKKLDSISIINSLKENRNIGLWHLWRPTNITFLSKVLAKIIKTACSNLILPITQAVNLNFNQMVFIRISADFVSDLILLPLDLYKLHLIVTANTKTTLLEFWNYKFNLSLFILILLKVSINRFFESWLDHMIYYSFNMNQFNNKFMLIMTLKLSIELIKFAVKLPIETLTRRFQLNHLLINCKEVENAKIIINPTDINTSAVWCGLWSGWKISLTSLLCNFAFKIMNRIDDDLALEKF